MSAADDASGTHGPLYGVRVIELAGKGPSQFGAMVLADLGADVIRVDRPTEVDRPMGFYDPRLDLLNRGRRSIALDLSSPDGVDTVLALVTTADAVVVPFRPGVADRLGIGSSDCLRVNPDVVYAGVTGWGADGPDAQRAGHDINFLAANGVLDMIGRADGPPVPPLNLVGDFGGGGMLLAVAILAGIHASRGGSGGQVVDVSMLEASSLLTTVVHSLKAMGDWGPRGTNLLDTGAPYYDVYRTRDDKYMSVGAMERKFYLELLSALDLGDDPMMVAAHHDRSLWAAAKDRLTEAFAVSTRDEWEQVFRGRDACVEAIRTVDEAASHPQVKARNLYPSIFGVSQPAPVPRYSVTPLTVKRPPPKTGEHADEILAELAEFDRRTAYDAR
ncbi:CaiB/BaiF CoA transferase family protein [Rhodococcus opacus]|uniref:Carnitine dehydratase n=1 Tax=Rhodococcus opacus TaxID=37919 RepID=A0A2S8J4T1_RHOOP|nr:CaiB/BaiF CoA-transferase family protein [Rhodococcus opacus]PQP21977.1 carnitine dehydratase [Rhodococcus opacus]